ncbi:MBL fold metallo-hydrolase [Leekyejoonella antrihumi]|uniref:MBL fold metallo-hydrolase n=1 Tax=Leekyejoonella antrihumi TaxID=1660198 RepID=A0A563E7P0_9MICO|nr:MBL fold metallo-hydrolase [Leekyejoonella antrihumi]TWP38546.1 MBL fold metallo-hydrolase [Leekyejoonella antrihumi]
MLFTQYYLECLSQASYLVGDETSGRAVVIDPRRDIAEYLDDAKAHGLTIVGIISTHFHADFLSGHLELARETGAWIGYGAVAQPEFEVRSLTDGERIGLGEVTLQILATPGHTPESISVLVYEHADDPVAYGVLTGDALFIGDVGRPDLLASVGVTADELGRMLYDSVQHRLMGLPDAVRVFPAHGAGSSCGKNLSTERQSTIGEQRALNYACQPMSEAEFLAVVTGGQPPTPGYFAYDATLNKQRRRLRDTAATIPALTAEQVDAALAEGAVLHDARDPREFATGHLRGAINVPWDGRLAETVGTVLTPEQQVVILAPESQEQQVAMRFARIGFDNVVGYVADPDAYLLLRRTAVAPASRLTANQAKDAITSADVQTVDIRNQGELIAGMLPGACHIPLAQLASRADELDPDRPVLLYCASGWRSSVGASLLRAKGFADVSDLLGGYGAWQSPQPAAS